MLKRKRYGAIDIGSNGVRMIISDVLEQNGQYSINKVSFIKAPIRLGLDVFKTGIISDNTRFLLSKALKGFFLLLDVYKVNSFRVCATSAMRQAENKEDLVKQIYKESGVKIEIIDGIEEAEIMANADILGTSCQTNLFVDVGGGSTEYSVFSNGNVISSKSFNFGTLRGKKMFESDSWKEAKYYIKTTIKNIEPFSLIGSGGNINTIVKFLSGTKKQLYSISYKSLKNFSDEIKPLSFENLCFQYGFKPDRSDVIKPALKIYLNTMKWCKAKKIIVPRIGLVDGIIKKLYLADKSK